MDAENWLLTAGKEHEIVMDEPTKLGGMDTGPSPLHALLASLAGCEQGSVPVTVTPLAGDRSAPLSTSNGYAGSSPDEDQDREDYLRHPGRLRYGNTTQWLLPVRLTMQVDQRAFRGIQGVPVRYQKVRVRAQVKTDATQEAVNELAHQVLPFFSISLFLSLCPSQPVTNVLCEGTQEVSSSRTVSRCGSRDGRGMDQSVIHNAIDCIRSTRRV